MQGLSLDKKCVAHHQGRQDLKGEFGGLARFLASSEFGGWGGCLENIPCLLGFHIYQVVQDF